MIPFLAFSAFIKIDERYAERAVQSLNNCFFFGAQIKVQFSKQNDNQRNTDNHRSSSDHRRQNLPSGLSGINVESREFDRFDPPPSRASAPLANQSARFVIDDFSQLSGQRPSCPMPRRDEIDQLITRRKRLEVRLPLSLSHPFLSPFRLLDNPPVRAYTVDLRARCARSAPAATRISAAYSRPDRDKSAHFTASRRRRY